MWNNKAQRVAIVCLGWLLATGNGLAQTIAEPPEGQPVDVAPYGQVVKGDADGKEYGLLWEDPRDLFRVVVAFAPGTGTPNPKAVRLEYWQSGWPERRIPRDQPSGAGSSGWLDVGDWFQGRWKQADVKLETKGETWTYTFNPLNAKEFPKIGDFAVPYRTTFKLRLVSDSPLPQIARLEAFTDSLWRPLAFELEWGGNAEKKPQIWDGRLEVFNGRLGKVAPLPNLTTVAVEPDNSWKSTVEGATSGVCATILYAEPQGYNSFDETVITVRTAQDTFSFLARDLVKSEQILIPGYGVLVRKAGVKTTYADALKSWQAGRVTAKDLYSRVSEAPEQTLPQAWNDTPLKDPHHIPMSFEGGRQHFSLDEQGNVSCDKRWTTQIHGKDTDRCSWRGRTLRYRFGLPDSRPVDRHLVDGYLPIMVGTWEREGVRYRQTAFVVPLMGIPPAGGRIWADDTLVMMLRFEMERTGAAYAEAQLDFTAADAKSEPLTLDGDLVVTAAQKPAMPRMRVFSGDQGGGEGLAGDNGKLTYRAKLNGSKPLARLDVAIPFVTLSDPKELALLRGLSFDEQLSAVGGYWQGRMAAGCRIETPEPMINDFYRADIAHLLINTEREVGVSDYYMPKVGTFNYGVFSNESCMMLNDLEVRGYPKLVERALDGWLHYQGSVGLPGDFSTKDGVLYGAGGYEMGEYNQHHGWILWMMGEHYWFTRDRAWLDRAAPGIIKGCDWVIQQRHRTTEQAQRMPIRAIERGLMPPGRLEDIGDWRCWLSTNVYSWRGLHNAGRALEAAGHPEGKRLMAEADAYRADLLAAFTEAMRRSPVVRLRDGSWIPHVPSDVHRRGRSFGWITETLEGAIHLVSAGVIGPQDRLATWIIQDYEDNLYLSEQFGYSLPDKAFDRFWFSLGGVSMQANLLHNPVAYLLRDEPKHFLRAYFNAFSVSYFPDTRMMTEHALPNVGDWRGDHFKSSDESNSTYWLRCMFVQERGDELLLGAAIPRYWLADGQRIGVENTHTHFGPMSVQMESAAGQGRIEMIVDPPLRNPPKLIRARFRHPDGLTMTACEVNGRPYNRFDPAREWVEITEMTGPVRIVAHYDGSNPRPPDPDCAVAPTTATAP